MQSQNQPPVDPNIMAQVDSLTKTALAETQRKANKDAQELTLKTQEINNDMIKNTENNLTEERIKAAELSRDAVELQHEQLTTVMDAQHKLQANLGVQQ